MKHGPKPKPESDKCRAFTPTCHPEFLRLFNQLPGSNGTKIEKAFGFNRLRPELGFQRPEFPKVERLEPAPEPLREELERLRALG